MSDELLYHIIVKGANKHTIDKHGADIVYNVTTTGLAIVQQDVEKQAIGIALMGEIDSEVFGAAFGEVLYENEMLDEFVDGILAFIDWLETPQNDEYKN